jgi:hypothetical protein
MLVSVMLKGGNGEAFKSQNAHTLSNQQQAEARCGVKEHQF